MIKNLTKNRILIAASLAILGAGGYYLSAPLLDSVEAKKKTQETTKEIGPTSSDAGKAPVLQKEVVLEPTPELKKLPQPQVVQSFKIIQAKVFKTEDEQGKLKKIVSDAAYLQQLTAYLLSAEQAKAPEFRTNQNAVIDILLEALKSGDKETAQASILEIVGDPQVENKDLPQPLRETLAGVKAELLYQASANDSAFAEQMQQSLPGPVSQKIWKNVLQRQAENVALSHLELQTRLAEKSH